jgi:TolB-like protein/tetratricopeptide (TPR) repeat protein
MVYRFDQFELDPARYELRRAGTRVTLEPRVMEVLAYLVGRRDRIVTKDELLAAVWPGQEVSEAALTRAIHAARRALGGAHDGWIRTVYGRGFVFKAPATCGVPDAEVASVGKARPQRVVPSVAVLPFADLSSAHDQSYFCDGLVQEVIDALGRVDGVTVASRTSSLVFGAAATDVRTIGERLNVSAVLEGSVRKDAGRLRVSVQLVGTSDNYRLWSSTFDRRVADVFAVQEEIATSVARALGAVVKGDALQAITGTPRTTPDAYDCYLRGRQLCGRPSAVRLEAARQFYRRSVAIDPAYAPGWAGYADCNTFLHLYWGGPAEDLTTADEMSLRAVEARPDLAECQAARACVLGTLGNRREAHAAFQTALRLKPRLAKHHYLYGRFAFGGEDFTEAIRGFGRAVALSPHEAALHALLAKAYARAGRVRDARAANGAAVTAAEGQLAVDPTDERTLYFAAGALVANGEPERGVEWADRALALTPDDAVTLVHGAAAYAGAQRVSEALDLLERGFEAGFRHRAWIVADPAFDPIRSQPRLVTLIGDAGRPARVRRLPARPRSRALA